MEFKDYGFKPVDVIKGLNLYYSANDPKYLHIEKGKHAYWHLLDKDVTDAINWLREEHNIFYTPGMKVEDVSRQDDTKDIFDTPRYKFLSILSAELGFRTIVGPGNADKVEKDILMVVKHRNEIAKKAEYDRSELLRKLGCELGVPYPVVRNEADILERIEKLKEGNWPCENGNTFAEYMKKQFPKECKKWCVRPLKEGSVHDWVQYIFGELDGWRKRALKDEEERDAVYEELGMNPADNDVKDVVSAIKKLRDDRGKYKGMLNTMYGASCGDNVLPCYRDTCNNPKAIRERDAANEYKTELNKCREYILTVYREIFDCSNGDPEGSDKENLEDILEEYRRVTKCFEEKFAECDNLKRRLRAERSMCDHHRKENSRQYSYREEFLRKLCKEFGFTIDKCPNYLPAMENNILNSVKTLSESFDGANGELEEMTVELNELRKSHDNLSELYNAATKLLGEYLKEAKDILGIDSCDKDTVASAIKALKATYNSLRNDYDEVCEGYTKLQKDYDELGKAYSSVLKWNNSYANVRRLLEVPADADASVMVGALNKFMCDYEQLKDAYEKAKCNTNYFHEFEKNCSERQAFIFMLCEALDIDKESIGSFFKDQESAILKAIEENHEATASIDQLRKKWHERYTSEHIRANGEHKRAEKCFGEIAALKTQAASLERSLKASANEQVGIDAFRNEIRRLEAEKAKVINALGQDIWDDCVK